jgi:hypothetical protein
LQKQLISQQKPSQDTDHKINRYVHNIKKTS